jgi:DNA-binding NtrC family response regulator
MSAEIKPQAKAVRILVVDDQAGMRVTMQKILAKNGYEVVLAEDGTQALKAVAAQKIDVIFMDIKMPGLSGVETFLKIKQINPKLPVIMMTAFAVEEEIRRAIQNGAYCVVNKPFDMNRVLELISACLDQRSLVLVVDDEVHQRQLMTDVLSMHNFRVVTVETGEACMRALSEKGFQVILLDMNLPGIDGLEVLRQVKSIRPDVPVIMISANSEDQLLQKALSAGSMAYLRKPFSIEHLLKLLDQARAKLAGGKP